MKEFRELEQRFMEKRLDKAYRLQGSMNFQGLPIKIENRVGSVRRWVDENGNKGKTKMHTRYGYISKTEGTDGDAVDVYVSDINPQSDKVFVIHQKFPDTGEYDEDKCMLGFNSKEEAVNEFYLHYDSKDFFDSVEEFTMDEFKQALKDLKGHKITKNSFEKAMEILAHSEDSYILDAYGNPVLNKADKIDAILHYSGLQKQDRLEFIRTIDSFSKEELSKAILSKDKFVLAQLRFRNKRKA